MKAKVNKINRDIEMIEKELSIYETGVFYSSIENYKIYTSHPLITEALQNKERDNIINNIYLIINMLLLIAIIVNCTLNIFNILELSLITQLNNIFCIWIIISTSFIYYNIYNIKFLDKIIKSFMDTREYKKQVKLINSLINLKKEGK